jgi:hypothetical protein
MPLSEQEQRLLEAMERSLYQNDADFVATVGARSGRPPYRSIVIGILIALAGVAVLVAGVIIQQPLIGVLGFGVMLTGVLIAINPQQKTKETPAGGLGATSGQDKQQSSSFMERLNDRWDRRQGG